MNKLFCAAVLVFTVFVLGCNYTKKEVDYPDKPVTNPTLCDTAAVTYSSEITSILVANCYRCHAGSADAGSGYKLDTYNGVKIFVNNDILLKAISHQQGVVPMPIGAAKLSDCDIAIIRNWIRLGALNN